MSLTLWRIVVWNHPISVESDTDRTSDTWLELVPVHLDNIGVGNHDVVSHNPGLSRALMSSDAVSSDHTEAKQDELTERIDPYCIQEQIHTMAR